MKTTGPSTVQCPACQRQLPGWSQQCQFCGAPIVGVQRPPDAYHHSSYVRSPWQQTAYYVVSAYWVLAGIAGVVIGFGIFGGPGFNTMAGAYYGSVGTANLVLGVGLLFEHTWAQFFAKWVSYLNVVFGLLIVVIAASARRPDWLGVSFTIFNILVCGFLIYLIAVVGDA